VTTLAYERISAAARLGALLAELRVVPLDETARLAARAASVRTTILETPIASDIASAALAAYRAFGADAPVSVVVRSSATAEDLPDASFAGQQGTFLKRSLAR
jgi:pyruvate, water dikinase